MYYIVAQTTSREKQFQADSLEEIYSILLGEEFQSEKKITILIEKH
jgi:hypothetical protein